MVKKSLQWVLYAALWFFGIVLFVLVVAAAGVHFLLMPNINDYKEKIAAYASRATNQKVAIGHIKADWQGLNPHFTVNNIDVFDAQSRPALQLNNTEVTLSWLSVPKLEPHLAALTIRDPALTIRRIASGEIFIAGISTRGESKPDAMNWLLRQSQLSVVNARVMWLDEMRKAPPLSLDQIQLDIISSPWKRLLKNHEVVFSAVPSIGTQHPIVVTGNVYGNDVSKLAQWSGDLVVVLKSTDLAAFKPWVDYPIELQQGVASSFTNFKFAENQLQSLNSDIKAANLVIKLKTDNEFEHIKTLSGKLAWKNLHTDPKKTLPAYNFKLENFQVTADKTSAGTGLNLSQVYANYTQSENNGKSLQLNVPELNLQALSPYLLQADLPEEMKSRLTGLAPKGVLHDLILQWQAQSKKADSYVISTRFEGLTALAHEKIPGFSNLSGHIKANQRGGLLTLDSQSAELDLKDILRWPVPVTKMQGEVLWDIRDKATEIEVKQLAISNPHLSGVVDMTYLMDGNKGGLLDLQGKFGQGNAQYASFYYPIILGEDTLHWLDTSIKQGRAEDIQVIVKGRLDDFPFANKQHKLDPKLGQFRVTAKVSDAVLEYGSDWPQIEGLGLDLLFEGKRMELNANTGRIFGTQIVKSRATIEQLDADNPILEIISEAKGPVLEGLRFVNNSPVLELTKGFTETLKTSGNGKLNLDLKIPLNNIEASLYKGAYAIINATLQSEAIPTLTRVNGVLEFTESSLNTKNIRALAYGSPVVFNVQSDKDKAIRIAVRGRLNDEAIRNVMGGEAATYLSGTADWAADVLVQRPRISIGIRSDLFGLTSTLPPPFAKEANERIGLRVDKRQDETTDVTTVVLGSRLGARMVSALENGQLKPHRAVVNLNDRGPASGFNAFNEFNNLAKSPKGMQVYGSLSYLNADAWRKVAADLKSSNTSTPGSSQQNSNFSLGRSDLKIDTLDVFDRRINQLRIQNKTAQDDLQFNIQSREISGDIQWDNQNNGKLIARLSNLTIPESLIKSKTPTDKEPVKNFQKLVQDYPALDITATNFEFNKKQFGALELVAYPQQDDWIIKKLKFSSPDGTLDAEGEWNNWTRNPNTRLTVNWDIKDLGNTLKRLGYPDVINAGEGDLKGQLNWAGSPHEFDTLSLNGNLQFDMRKGQVLQVKPGVGRLFGLLSLQSLPRRLNLDFRDLFNSGFAFDKINATVLIDHGILRSDNFMMAGPAADVTIKGETNLRTETQQLHVKVVPNISDSVSLAALAGGPLAGAVAFLAQKVLKDPLNKIVSTEYDIVGTWDEPRETKTADAPESNSAPLNQPNPYK